MKPRPPLPRSQLMFGAVLFLLAVLAILLWLNDPSHQPAGRSRVDWPPSKPA